jgi:hypothetical protein
MVQNVQLVNGLSRRCKMVIWKLWHTGRCEGCFHPKLAQVRTANCIGAGTPHRLRGAVNGTWFKIVNKKQLNRLAQAESFVFSSMSSCGGVINWWDFRHFGQYSKRLAGWVPIPITIFLYSRVPLHLPFLWNPGIYGNKRREIKSKTNNLIRGTLHRVGSLGGSASLSCKMVSKLFLK